MSTVKTNQKISEGGYSIVELIVALTLFVTVTAIASGSTLTLLSSSKEARESQGLSDSMEFILEDMTRNLRTGSSYHCGLTDPDIGDPANCLSGGSYLAFEPQGGDPNSDSDQVIYRLNGSKLERSNNGGTNFFSLFDSSITVTTFNVYVDGAYSSGLVGGRLGATDNKQARVKIVLGAEVRDPKNQNTNKLTLQTSLTQRQIDL